MILISILIPSRFRFDRVLNTIRSVFESCDDPSLVEVVVRFHADDAGSVSRVSELSQFGSNVRHIFGPTLNGYDSLHDFCQELEDDARGDWHWHMNDDMLVQKRGANGFDTMLKRIPMTGVLVQPDIHQLNTSNYEFDPRGPAPIYPANALKQCGCDSMPEFPDVGIYDALVTKAGWKVQFLPGIAIWHQWTGHGETVNRPPAGGI